MEDARAAGSEGAHEKIRKRQINCRNRTVTLSHQPRLFW